MMNSAEGIYRVNVRRLALLTLPRWLRRPLAGALLYAGVSPLGRLVGELRRLRRETGYRLGHNGQVCKLRGVLNDVFDGEERRITVTDAVSGSGGDRSVVWQRETGRWVMLPLGGAGAALIHREGLGGTGDVDFVVNVPGCLSVDETRVRAVVNMYKLAGKRFAINYK